MSDGAQTPCLAGSDWSRRSTDRAQRRRGGNWSETRPVWGPRSRAATLGFLQTRGEMASSLGPRAEPHCPTPNQTRRPTSCSLCRPRGPETPVHCGSPDAALSMTVPHCSGPTSSYRPLRREYSSHRARHRHRLLTAAPPSLQRGTACRMMSHETV